MAIPPQRQTPDHASLKHFYVGRDIKDVPKPAVVLDIGVAKRHCESMLAAVKAMGVGFRAHIKTHKTPQLARLQVGENPRTPAKFVASTVVEIEMLAPTLQEYRSVGRPFNVLYGIPFPGSQVERLARVGKDLGNGSLSVMIDHPAQLHAVRRYFELTGSPLGIYLKVDTGYHRAGLPPNSVNKGDVLKSIMALVGKGEAAFVGLYSHSSLSYSGSSVKAAMDALAGEISGCIDALESSAAIMSGVEKLTISVGASPQVTAIENFVQGKIPETSDTRKLREALERLDGGMPGGINTELELHAGVYSVLDVQQVSTRSRAHLGKHEEEIAVSVVAEVCSVYNEGERDRPEALVAVGTLGLGREPCAAYSGWGIADGQSFPSGIKEGSRLVVDRISQEHSILAWEGEAGKQNTPVPLEVGQHVRIYPNHACVTGALYGWYLVVNSGNGEGASRVEDVWIRASGW